MFRSLGASAGQIKGSQTSLPLCEDKRDLANSLMADAVFSKSILSLPAGRQEGAPATHLLALLDLLILLLLMFTPHSVFPSRCHLLYGYLFSWRDI